VIYEAFEKKVRHRIHHIFDNEAKTRFKNFRNIGIGPKKGISVDP